MKNKFLWFYMIMVAIISYFPIRWSMIARGSEMVLFSIGFMSGIFLFSFSSFSLLSSIKPKSKVFLFLLKVISFIFLCLPMVMYLIYLTPYVTIKKGLTEADVLAFFKTYGQEATTYFISNVKWGTFVWTGIILILFIVAAFGCSLKYKSIFRKNIFNFITLLFGITLFGALIHNPMTEPVERAMVRLQEYKAFSEKVKSQKK